MQQGTPPLEAQPAGVVKGRLHSIRAEIARLDGLNPPLPLVFLLAIVALYVRAPELFFAPSLWAEDVDRFVEAFAKNGFASVFMALHGAGYHQLFERLAAAASLAILPLKHAESAFHVVSILVVGFAGVMAWVCLPTRSLAMRLAAVLAIVYVPIDGSTIYLTLVNTQWILAPVTMLLIVTEFIPRSRHKAAWCALLAVLCLTGPFAVMAMPVVLARVLLYRDLKREKLFYASIVVPVAIQCVALARNAATRLTTVEYSDSVRAWLRGILDNTLYQLIPNRGLLLLFGVLLVALVWRLVREQSKCNKITHLNRRPAIFPGSCTSPN